MAVCMKFRFIPANTGEQNGCLSGTRSDKQIERKILHVYIDLLLFLLASCFFETPRGDRFYCLCTVRRKGMPQAVKSIRLRKRGCDLIMQKGNCIAVEWKDWTITTNFFS